MARKQKVSGKQNKKDLLDYCLQQINKDGIKAERVSKIIKQMEFVSTGSLALNEAIGKPGYPCGLVTEIVGPASCGKSLLTLAAESVVTRAGYYVIHWDEEENHGTVETNEWREVFKIDMDYVLQIPPTTAAEGMEAIRKAISVLGKDCKLIIIDSVSALVTGGAVKKEMTENEQPASVTKLLHRFFDLMRIENKHAALLCINQNSSNIGGYGSPVTKGGGNAMKYDPHLSLEVKSEPILSSESDSEGVIGLDMSIKVAKNKIGTPKKIAKCKFLAELGGFDIYDEIVEIAVLRGIIKKSAPWYYLGDKTFKGKKEIVNYLLSKRKVFNKIILKVTGKTSEDLGL